MTTTAQPRFGFAGPRSIFTWETNPPARPRFGFAGPPYRTSNAGVAPDLAILPANHSGLIKVIITGSGTSFVDGVTGGTVDHGTLDHIEVQSPTVLWAFVATDSYTGTVTFTETGTGSATGTFTVAAATISVTPNTLNTGVTTSVTITTTAGAYLQEIPTSMFTVEVGATISNISVSDNLTATADVLIPAGSTGTTITDRTNSDYATADITLAPATTYTVTPSPTTSGTLDVAKTFTFQANGICSDIVTGSTSGSGAWAGTITLDDTNEVTQSYTETVTVGAVLLNFTNSGTLIDASEVTFLVFAPFASSGANRMKTLLRP